MQSSFAGSGGGQVVSVLAFYSDDASSNPAEVYNFSVKLLLKRIKINKKEDGVGPFLESPFARFKKVFKFDDKNIQRLSNSAVGLDVILNLCNKIITFFLTSYRANLLYKVQNLPLEQAHSDNFCVDSLPIE